MSTSISKQQLNAAVKALAKLDRPAAVDILARFGAINTVELKTELWQAVFESCEAALKKFDASTS